MNTTYSLNGMRRLALLSLSFGDAGNIHYYSKCVAPYCQLGDFFVGAHEMLKIYRRNEFTDVLLNEILTLGSI